MTLVNSLVPHRLSRRLAVVSMAVAILTTLGGMGAVGARQATSAVVSGAASVNIRACPTIDCQVIGSATLGDSIEITGAAVDGFYPVTWYGRAGYAFALYLALPGQAPRFVESDSPCQRIALVFNIGIGDPPSQTIVDTLLDTDTTATMFPMGWWALEEPDYLQQLDAAGFVIGTHGDQRFGLTTLSNEAIMTDVTDSVTAIESVIGRKIDPYFTPYAADTDARVQNIVASLGLLPVGWNVAANDYGADATETGVYDLVTNGIYPGAIVEMHLDGPATEQSTALALPRIIADVEAAGYEFVTIPELTLPCDG